MDLNQRGRIIGMLLVIAVTLVFVGVFAPVYAPQIDVSSASEWVGDGVESGMLAYMSIDDSWIGAIEGSVTREGNEGDILVVAYNHYLTSPSNPTTGRMTSGVTHHNVTITKVFDRSSPRLYQALAIGAPLDLTIKFYKPNPSGVEEQYYTVELEQAQIVSIRPWMPNALTSGDSGPWQMEDVTFNYERIDYTYIPPSESSGLHFDMTWETRTG